MVIFMSTKIITYGTFDLLHIGHIRLLQRAKSLGGGGRSSNFLLLLSRFNRQHINSLKG